MSIEALISVIAVIIAAVLSPLVAHWLMDKKRTPTKSKKASSGSLIGSIDYNIHSKWINDLNKLFEEKFKIFGITDIEPELIDDGMLDLELNEKKLSVKYKQNLSNDTLHAILCNDPIWSDRPIVFRYKKVFYSGIKAMRFAGKKPRILSANAIIFCDDKKELYLQRRSDDIATYPGGLHTFGGAFLATEPKRRAPDDGRSLVTTAEREVREETNLKFNWPTGPMLVAQETATGFIQLVLLGVNLSRAEVDSKRGNWEGDIVTAEYSNIEKIILSESQNWVPSGRGHLLAWLALGAPNATLGSLSEIKKPKQIFEEIVKKLV